MAPSKTFAFLGATGGCTLKTLLLSLEESSYQCVALARTPSKLEKLLKDNGVTDEVLKDTSRLIIVEGNAKEEEDIKKLLQAGSHFPSNVLFGVGGAPTFKLSLTIGLDDPHVCEFSMVAVLDALRALRKSTPEYKAPYLSCISTTGLEAGMKDVPMLLKPLYGYLLHEAHLDKAAMERTVEGGEEGLLSGWTVLRPTLLVEGEKGNVKYGWSGSKEKPIPKGYSIGKGDVGRWIFDHLVKAESKDELKGKKVVLGV